jgi:hypothetical protein
MGFAARYTELRILAAKICPAVEKTVKFGSLFWLAFSLATDAVFTAEIEAMLE